ncbi:siphovirus Gp157 family protein [Enterococcus casseliflavus]|uniref:siphovirus Gp157 family protein n=1 Tax=Enterococcus casseliflavus TaxID=37734 RepID=UPI0022E46F7D|nr:siphovirus Gp157 family protein [Enterococcus casseliflavus]
MKLYELTGAFNQVADMLEYDSENTAIIDTLESIDLAIEEKADGYAKLIRNQEASSKAFDEEIKRMKERKQAVDNNVKRMKLSLQNAMVEIGKTKFKTDLFSFNIQKNQPSVEIIDESLIPDKFKKVTIDFDKNAIKKAEEDVPGVEIKQSESLRIR